MGKTKKILSMMLVLCMTCCMLTIPAKADNCCSVNIQNITQQDGKVVVDWTTYSSEDNRNVTISIIYEYTYGNNTIWTSLDTQTITVPIDSHSGTTEFDSSILIPGVQYSIEMRFEDYCDNYHCEWSEEKDFVCLSGMPVYEISDTYGESIEISHTKVALKATTKQSGMHELWIDSDSIWAFEIRAFGGAGYYNGYEYFKKDQTTYFVVALYPDTSITESCTAKFAFDLAEHITVDALAPAPVNGDTVFSLKDCEGLYMLNFPVTGVYDISTVCSHNGNILIKDMNGDAVYSEDFDNSSSVLLDKGSYYYVAEPWEYPADTYTTTIKYKQPETVQFDKEITAPKNTQQYILLKLDNMAAVSIETVSGYWNAELISGDREYYLSEDATIIPKGEYYVRYITYDDNAAYKIHKTDIPTCVIGNELTPYTDGYGYSFVFLKAPETAEYQFNSSDGINVGEDGWLPHGFSYLKMKAGESIYLSYYGTMSAEKYIPQYTPVNIDEDISFSSDSGKKLHYSYTADEQETYELLFSDTYSDQAYFENLKIYTDNKVICDESSVSLKKKEVKLAKGEKVYVDITPTTYTSYTFKVIVKEKPLQISGDTIVDCSNPQYSNVTREIIFTPSVDGYYDFSANKISGDDYAYISVDINGEELGVISYSNTNLNLTVYATSDEPLYINITKGSSQSAKVELKFTKITAKAITNISDFEITDDSYYSFTLPETGIYKIEGTAYYEDSGWREAGEYNYFFYPIIKNGVETSVSYDTYDGKAPTFFCGTKGDIILFKEQKMSYNDFVYPIKASITKVTAQQIQTDTIITTSDVYNIYSVTITKGGAYKFEDFSEELFDPNDGPYGTYYGNGYATFCDGYEWHYDDEYEENPDLIFNLNPGTYYIIGATYDNNKEDEHIPCAKFRLSKYFDDTTETEGFMIRGEKTSTGINYTISCEQPIPNTAKVYAAVYNGLQLIEFKPSETISLSGDIQLDNTSDSYTYKLFMWDENMMPICLDANCN